MRLRRSSACPGARRCYVGPAWRLYPLSEVPVCSDMLCDRDDGVRKRVTVGGVVEKVTVVGFEKLRLLA